MKPLLKEALEEYYTFSWEIAYGTDSLCPPGHVYEGLPYWVEYMPTHLQQEYLAQVNKNQFVNYND